MMTKTHQFFVLPYSSWAFLSSIFSFNLIFSLMIFFKFSNQMNFIFNLIFISFGSFVWWLFFSSEMSHEGKNSSSLEEGVKFAMILFISSEVFFFFSFFWSYFHYLLAPVAEISLSWPPLPIISFEFLNVPLINTLILLSSGVTVTASHSYLIEGKKNWSSFFLGLTILLGFIFTSLQILEYSSSFFSVSDSTFGTSFFILTGFHGLHVMIGSTFLMLVFLRSLNIISTSTSFLSFELASWYWHFVDVVWIFLYFFLYYMTDF